jgi:hypothetical protein
MEPEPALTVQSFGLALLSVAVATMLLLHIALTKSSVCGKEFNKKIHSMK